MFFKTYCESKHALRYFKFLSDSSLNDTILWIWFSY